MDPAENHRSREDLLVQMLIEAAAVLAHLLTDSLETRADEITVTQYEALIVLANSGPTRSSELTEALGVDPSTATRLCDRLVRRGFIVRERPEHNRREVRIALSNSGRELLQAVASDRQAKFAAIISAVSPARRPALMSALELLIDTGHHRMIS